MTRQISENLTKDTSARIYANSEFFFSEIGEMIRVRIFAHIFYPLAGCAAHLRASITEIAQLQHPYKNLSGRDCFNLSLASCILGVMT